MNNKRKTSKGYWVWGQFDSQSTKQITHLHQRVNKKLNGPNFDVHLTISGAISNQEDLNRPILDNLSNQIPQFKVQLNGMGYKNEFFQSLFINVLENNNLKNIKRLIDKKFNLNEDQYFPHISLYYGNAGQDSKVACLNELKLPNEVVLDKISIVKVDEEIKSWTVLKSYSLLQNTR